MQIFAYDFTPLSQTTVKFQNLLRDFIIGCKLQEKPKICNDGRRQPIKMLNIQQSNQTWDFC